MTTSDFIREDSTGRIYLTGRDDVEHLITTQTLYEKTITERSNNDTADKDYTFKLVTVRRLTNYTLDSLNALLTAQNNQLRNIALLTGQAIPFNNNNNNNNITTLTNVYGVFIDEDLYGLNNPVYVFTTNSLVIKCYITANGVEKDAYSVHIAHQTDIINNPDGTKQVSWRLFTTDSNLNGKYNSYFLESFSLPTCFSHNFDINSLYYLGGGSWTAIGVDINDRIPVTAIASTANNNYIPIGTVANIAGNTQALSVVDYSFTPTYSFTWCRGKLNLNKRTRSASSTYTTADGTVQLEKLFNYQLNLTQRVNLIDVLGYGKEIDFTEYSYGRATYVGTTNEKICSPYQCPDYGTDALRTSLQSYNQTTNVIRPVNLTNTSANNVITNKYSDQNLCFTPILAASNDMAFILRFNFSEANGSINHGSEIHTTQGSRSYGYSYSYKYWWTYGKITSFYPYGDTNLYQSIKTSDSFAGTPVGSIFSLGQLILAPGIPNAVETTWNSPVNPPSGYFEYLFGTLNFIINYNNPPIFGHDSIYYYQINPPKIDGSSDNNNYTEVDNADSGVQQSDITQQLYSQILAGLGGFALAELNIGNVILGGNETDTLLMREPNSTQSTVLFNNPQWFPNQFWNNNNIVINN
jgi:hypothetical protein